MADQAFASERLGATGAYNASGIARSVEGSARELSLNASEETTSQGAAIANATAAAQVGAVRSPGFFDYMAIGANAYTTYTGLKAKTNIMGA